MKKSPPKVFLIIEPTVKPFGWPDGEVALDFYQKGEGVAGFTTKPAKSSETALEITGLVEAMGEWVTQQDGSVTWKFFIRHASDPAQPRVEVTRKMRTLPLIAEKWLIPPKKPRSPRSKK